MTTVANGRVMTLVDASNDGAMLISAEEPYIATLIIEGAADLLFHRWSNEAVELKAKAAKNSAAKKTDDLESYVYRTDAGNLALPGEYLRQAITHAAKFKADPRSPRKSAMDLFKAGIVSLTNLADLGKSVWDYEDRRRVVVQRAAITRARPALRAGWRAEITLMVNTPEYIASTLLHDVASQAGRLVGVGDFRPTYGRFQIVRFDVGSL